MESNSEPNLIIQLGKPRLCRGTQLGLTVPAVIKKQR